MASEILGSEVNKILDHFLITELELEQKEKILRNIDNELNISDELNDLKEIKTNYSDEKINPNSYSMKDSENKENEQIVQNNNLEVEQNLQNENLEINQNKDIENLEEVQNKQIQNLELEQNKYQNYENKQIDEKIEEITNDMEVLEVKCQENKENEVNASNDLILEKKPGNYYFYEILLETLEENSNICEDIQELIESNQNENETEYIPIKEKSDKIELLDYLLDFIHNNNELNYVLSGYFSKLFSSLLNRNHNLVNFF